ncbi:MAG: CPBP family intramembrane glutamic endopeptidase [Candidatus Puniceispirillales bacterium]
MIKSFGDEFFLNHLDLKKYFFTSFLLLFYLLFSVIPQEIIFRFLFFFKYKDYFRKFEVLLLNSLVFSFCHLIYFDIYILLFSFFGNLLFTFNYMKNESLLVVIIEHFLLGQTLIILGFFDNFNFSLIKKLYNLALIN